ncbi:small GTP-binding protein domain, variant [Spizellomyces punctatus DAOM BR117]|uniref:Small GTP-binding protein domain, variant n=1 Tax=Spizellomyces punctatus (strain DAOM BR117) TaxID=645134 RepID=A0A0L0HMG4_SPIPD|nr:small GTP-binding protein domain, variant [Spizellomyces punctatus DAOM BR117]KND02263.1 small GTP-binding protein domain, variant [Spizellomyces punctatus DAOM BR117]|eukprot:XP_016610302.1 small GTP-binding protein domain, variant [Spizellomyces punctatus DAOM BR117]
MSPPCQGCFTFLKLTRLGRRPRRLVVLVLGLDGAGKTSVLLRLQGDPNQATKTSWGFTTATVPFDLPKNVRESADDDQNKKRSKKQKPDRVTVTLYDIGGDVKIRPIWKNYYAEAHACIYVIDSGNRERISEASEALNEVYQDPRMKGKPLLILANKQDATNALTPAELFETLKIQHLVPENKTLVTDTVNPDIDGWWASIKPCIANVPDPDLDGSAFASEMHILPLFRVILNSLSTLEPRCRKDVEEQQEEWDKDRMEQRKRVDDYRQEQEKKEKAKTKGPDIVGSKELHKEVETSPVGFNDEPDQKNGATEVKGESKSTAPTAINDGPQQKGTSSEAVTEHSASHPATTLFGAKSKNRIYPVSDSTEHHVQETPSETSAKRSNTVHPEAILVESASTAGIQHPPSPFGVPVTIENIHTDGHADERAF